MKTAETQIARLLTATCRAAQQSSDPVKRAAGSRWERWIQRQLDKANEKKKGRVA